MRVDREAERKKSFVGGEIVFNDRHSTLFCLVRNISAGGAKIEVEGALRVPAEFDLRVNGRDRELKAQVVWRTAGAIGVRFLAELAPRSTPQPSEVESL